MINTLCIGGGFDVLHRDHKEFINRCISAYSKRYKCLSNLAIGLFSDNRLSIKGNYRPYFSYEWREQDMREFISNKNIDFRILKIDSLASDTISLDKNRTAIAVRSDDLKSKRIFESQKFKIILVPPVNKYHTTDIEKRLLSSMEKSNCKIRKVGALLVRDGEIVKEGFSGNGDCNCCNKYKVYSVSGNLSRNTPCDFPHAEEACLDDAKKGDDLFITCSPCMSCAEKIASKGIRRVVFLEEYYDTKPLEYLRKNGVLFRKAGID